MKKGSQYLLLFLVTCYPAFAQKPTPTLFKSLPTTESGINFGNTLKESPGLNIITYEYFYNGGGVGLADFNNDGLVDIYFSANMQPAKLYLNKGNLHFEDITAKAGVGGKEDGKRESVSQTLMGMGDLIFISAIRVLWRKNKEEMNCISTMAT